MSHTFAPQADDKFATATALPVEVMTVKPSGYINHRGAYPAALLPQVREGIQAYYAGEGRPEPVIYTRTLGEVEWNVLDAPEVEIPDTLPDDFK